MGDTAFEDAGTSWADEYALTRAGERIDFVEPTAADVEIEVVDDRGEPVPDATVHVDDSSIGHGPGRIRVKFGDHGAWAVASPAMSSDVVAFRVERGEPPPRVTLRIREETGVALSVRFPPEEDEDEAFAMASCIPAEASLAALAGPSVGGPVQSARPREPVLWTGLAPGRYLVGAFRAGPPELEDLTDPSFVTAVVNVTRGLTRVALDLPVAPEPDLVVTAVGPDGRPVHLRDAIPELIRDGYRHAQCKVRLRDGALLFWFEARHFSAWSSGGDPESVLRVRALAEEQGKMVEVPRGARHVVVHFEKPAYLDVQVENMDLALPGGSYAASLLGPNAYGEEGLESTGFARPGPVQPGDYTLRLEGAGRDPQVLAETKVRLVSGPNAATLALPRHHVVRTRCPSPGFVSLCPLVGGVRGGWMDQQNGEAGRDGLVVFPCVRPGRYEVEFQERIEANSSRTRRSGYMLIDVPASGEIAFAPEPSSSLRYHGPDGDEGLRSGDAIIAIDGARLRGDAEIDRLVRAALAKESVSLTVLREGRTIEVRDDLGDRLHWRAVIGRDAGGSGLVVGIDGG